MLTNTGNILTLKKKTQINLPFPHPIHRFLTKREQELNKRRKNAYDLLAWNQRLDQEEQEIAAIERQALAKWEGKDKKVKGGEKKSGRDEKAAAKREPSSPSSVSKDTGELCVYGVFGFGKIKEVS